MGPAPRLSGRSGRWTRPLLLAALTSATALPACTYHNTVFNAERLFRRAEELRRSGDEAEANALYDEVARRTSTAYGARPDSEWALEALVLLGRSQHRLGEHAAALETLNVADSVSEAGSSPSGDIEVYRAAVLADRGQTSTAIELVNQALAADLSDDARAEAHLLRGQWLLGDGRADLGWWDLDRAAEAERGTRVDGGLARLRAALAAGDLERAETAVRLLLSYPEGGARVDEVVTEIDRSADTWGAETAAALLESARGSPWEREARGRIRLHRAELLHRTGDTESAEEESWDVARALGTSATEARLQLARWRFAATEDIADAYAVRPILLPAATDPEAGRLVDAIDELERLTDRGLEEPLGLFAAAEVARDRLAADYLARGLLLAYVSAAPDEPWAAKALLAVLEVSATEGDRAWLLGRLEAYDGNPYVLAAWGEETHGVQELEEELRVRLGELRAR